MLPLFALFIRSVRDDMRSRAIVWSRMGIAFALLLVVFDTEGPAAGLRVFSKVVILNFLFICVAAVSYFATAISEEKEEGTFGLLQLTGLGPFAILLGKSTSRLVGGTMLLLVQVPIAMLAITLGGVRLDQVLSCYAVLAAFLFFACNVGLLGSVLGRSSGSAGLATAVFLTLFVCWPFLVSWAVYAFQGYPTGWTQIRKLVEPFSSPWFTPGVLGSVLSTRTTRADITPALIILMSGGIAAFVLARVFFERWRIHDVHLAAPKGRSRESTPKRDRQFVPGRAWKDAIYWRDFHFIHGGKKAFIAKAALYAGIASWTTSIAIEEARAFRGLDWWQDYCATIFVWIAGAILLESLFTSSRIYRIERRDKTLSALFILPHRFDRMLLSKRRAVFLSLAPGLFFGFIAFLAVLGPLLAYTTPNEFIFLLFGMGYIVAQVVLNHYLVAWFSLRFRWGGFPLALAVSWFGNVIVLKMGASLLPWSLLPMIAGTSALSIWLRHAFHRELRIAAGES